MFNPARLSDWGLCQWETKGEKGKPETKYTDTDLTKPPWRQQQETSHTSVPLTDGLARNHRHHFQQHQHEAGMAPVPKTSYWGGSTWVKLVRKLLEKNRLEIKPQNMGESSFLVLTSLLATPSIKTFRPGLPEGRLGLQVNKSSLLNLPSRPLNHTVSLWTQTLKWRQCKAEILWALKTKRDFNWVFIEFCRNCCAS